MTDVSQLKYKYLGWEAGYIVSHAPTDITLAEWAAMSDQEQHDVLEAPHCYEAVAEPEAPVTEAPKAGQV